MTQVTPLDELYRLWDELANVSVDEDGRITAPFWEFSPGSSVLEIQQSLAARNPDFDAEAVRTGVRKITAQDIRTLSQALSDVNDEVTASLQALTFAIERKLPPEELQFLMTALFEAYERSFAASTEGQSAEDELQRTPEGIAVLSISDDDVCSNCTYCKEASNDMRACQQDWPGLRNEDGYVVSCVQFQALTPEVRGNETIKVGFDDNFLVYWSAPIADGEYYLSDSPQGSSPGKVTDAMVEVAGQAFDNYFDSNPFDEFTSGKAVARAILTAALEQVPEKALLHPTEAPAKKGLFVDLIAEQGPEFVAEMAAIGVEGPKELVPFKYWVEGMGSYADKDVAEEWAREEKTVVIPLYTFGQMEALVAFNRQEQNPSKEVVSTWWDYINRRVDVVITKQAGLYVVTPLEDKDFKIAQFSDEYGPTYFCTHHGLTYVF